tara:strand:+ start:24501 stop:24815 length:315 start_codon:yes stop_codon:yes gene_type:complete
MDKEMKPCPFCGSEARLDQRVTQSLWSSNDAVFSHVTCDDCDISGQDFCDDPDGEEAIEWWNRRSMPSVKLPDSFEAGDYMFATKVMNAGSVIAVLEDAGLTVE